MSPLPPPWPDRDPDFAALLNPFFVGTLLRDGATAYRGRNGAMGLPFALTFVLLPMVLHPSIRNSRPKTTLKRFSTWIRENPVSRAHMASSSRSLVPVVREGISVLMRAGLLAVQDTRISASGEIPAEVEPFLAEIATYREGATFCARWLSVSGEPSQIYEAIGIRP